VIFEQVISPPLDQTCQLLTRFYPRGLARGPARFNASGVFDSTFASRVGIASGR